MKAIARDVVERTWKKMASLTHGEIVQVSRRISADQPYVLAYLLGVDEDVLNQDERELLVYLGIVVFEMMRQGSKPLPRVTDEMLERALGENLEFVERCRGRGFRELLETVGNLVRSYGQPEILRYVLEALMEDSEEGTLIRDQMKGLIMIHLKTLIDCFDV